jgi:hypothetical protein
MIKITQIVKDKIIIPFMSWLDNSILLHICKWATNNVASLIAIPIAVLAIIVALYTDLFKEKSKEDIGVLGYFKIETYYNTFEAQKGGSQQPLPVKEISYNKDSTSYSHIVFIDKTLSLNDTLIEKEFVDFKNYVKNTLSKRDDKSLNEVKDFKLKNILFHNFLQMILTEKANKRINNLCVYFFDGETVDSHKFKKLPGSANSDAVLNVESISEDELRVLLDSLLQQPLFNDNEIDSNFKILFNEIKVKCSINELKNDNIIITIISDFDHNFDSPNQRNWDRIIKDNISRDVDSANRQYNLIILPTDETRKENSKKIVQTIQKHIVGCDNIVDINLEDFCNNNLDEYEKQNFENNIKAGFYSKNTSNSNTIYFYYPKENIIGFKVAEANIKFQKIKEWRLICSDNIDDNFNYYIKGNRKTGSINGDYVKNNIGDTIKVEMGFTPKINNEQQFRLEIVTQEGNILTYPIEFKEYMQGKFPDFGIWVLNILCIIIITCLLLITIHIKYVCYQKYISGKKVESTIFSSIWVLFVFAFFILQFFL